MDFYTPFCDCGERILHEHGAAFYVSVWDPEGNGGKGRIGLLAGPFTSHAESLRWVDPARKKAESADDRAVWYAFGTLAMKGSYCKPGILNKFLWKDVSSLQQQDHRSPPRRKQSAAVQ